MTLRLLLATAALSASTAFAGGFAAPIVSQITTLVPPPSIQLSNTASVSPVGLPSGQSGDAGNKTATDKVADPRR